LPPEPPCSLQGLEEECRSRRTSRYVQSTRWSNQDRPLSVSWHEYPAGIYYSICNDPVTIYPVFNQQDIILLLMYSLTQVTKNVKSCLTREHELQYCISCCRHFSALWNIMLFATIQGQTPEASPFYFADLLMRTPSGEIITRFFIMSFSCNDSK